MAKLFRKKDGSAVVKSSNGKIVNNLPAPPSLSGVSDAVGTTLPSTGLEERQEPRHDFSKMLELARSNSYASETAKIAPVNKGKAPSVVNFEMEYEEDDGTEEMRAINESSPPKIYYDNLDWRESYLLNASSGEYDIRGLSHYGNHVEDADNRLTLQAALAENVRHKLGNSSFQGVDSSDPTPYLIVSKDVSDIAKLIIADKDKYSSEEVEAATKIVENTPIARSGVLEQSIVNPAIAEKRGESLRFTKEADLVLQAGEKAILQRTNELESIKNAQQSVLSKDKRKMRRGGVEKLVGYGEQYILHVSNHHRIPRPSAELEKTRLKVLELTMDIDSLKNNLDMRSWSNRKQFGAEIEEKISILQAEKNTLLKKQGSLESKISEINLRHVYLNSSYTLPIRRN